MIEKSIREYLALVPRKTVDLALKIDAEELSSNPAKYIEGNRFSYTIAMNTWAYLIKEHSPYGWIPMIDQCSRQGLRKTVLDCCDFAQILIDSEKGDTRVMSSAYSLQLSILADVTGVQLPVRDPHDVMDQAYGNGLCTFLCMMRYLKRMTPLYADALDKVAIDSFVANQNRQKLRARRDPDPIFVEMVKAELPKGLIKRRISAFNKIRLCDIEFTSGVAYNASSKLLSKLEAINKLCPQYFDNQLSSIPYESILEYQHLFDKEHRARMVSVPKSFKTGRTIAMEDVFRQSVSRRMFTLADALLPQGIDLHDQSRNQKYAQLGSLDGQWATIDLSHASDDVTKVLVTLLFPYDYVKHLTNIAPTKVELPSGKTITLQSWATMGNSMTFVTECDVFWAICRAAVHFHQRHFGGDIDDTVIVYGDDIIVDSQAYETVTAFLQYFGFIVNEDKSYASGRYRESCGKEYFHGDDISAIYYPRFPVTPDEHIVHDGFNQEYTTSLSRLITLQHRLWYASKGAAHYLEQELLQIQPRLCYCSAGDTANDLYGYSDTFSQVRTLALYHNVDIIFYLGYKTVKFSQIWVNSKQTVKQHWSTADWDNPRNRFFKWREKPVYEAIPSDNSLYRRYLYQDFLKRGPRYASELDRLLGVSEPLNTPSSGRPHYQWGHDLI